MVDSDPTKVKRTKFGEDERSKVFVIMRYKDEDQECSKLKQIESAICDTLKTYRLTPVLARNFILDQQLWTNVRSCMDQSALAIVVFDSLKEPDYSPNVVLELGYFMALDRQFLLLKDDALSSLPCDLIGHVHSKFNLDDISKTVGDAISEWLEKLGYKRIQPIELIAVVPAHEARKQRTRKIIESLKVADKELSIKEGEKLIRHAGSLSSLAISKLEKHQDRNYHRLLLKERDGILKLLESGWIVRILVCPEAQLEWARLHPVNKNFAESHIYPRYDQLMKLITDNLDKSNLQIAFSPKLPHENILIVEGLVAFVGRRRLYQSGFPYTTIINDTNIIKGEIAEFDMLFGDSVALILDKEPNSEVEQYFESKELKEKVLEEISNSKKRWQELLS